MTEQWLPKETTAAQDHVIAHVVGTTVLGYFVFDEALHVVLDMGFIWTIFIDGQMLLLPQAVALDELEAAGEIKKQLMSDIERLARDRRRAEGVARITTAPVDCLITEVNFYANDEQRRLVLAGEEASLTIETSMRTAEIEVFTAES